MKKVLQVLPNKYNPTLYFLVQYFPISVDVSNATTKIVTVFSDSKFLLKKLLCETILQS